MHIEVFLGNLCVNPFVILGCHLCEQFYNLVDLLSNQDPFLGHLGKVDADLLEDHDHKQVLHQDAKVAIPEGNDEVGHVVVDELKHENLVDEAVFEIMLVPMILPLGNPLGHAFVNLAKEHDQTNIDARWSELEVERDAVDPILLLVFVSPLGHDQLDRDHSDTEAD